MGRGRAKAKQVKVARQLKYGGGGTDLDRLRAELGVGTDQRGVGAQDMHADGYAPTDDDAGEQFDDEYDDYEVDEDYENDEDLDDEYDGRAIASSRQVESAPERPRIAGSGG